MMRPVTLSADEAGLFQPLRIGSLSPQNRFVMAPMTRCFSPGGVPGPDVAAYYRCRAENEVGLIITEGNWIAHGGAANDSNVPRLHGDDALTGWSRVVAEVHAAGGKFIRRLWHVGLFEKPVIENVYAATAPVEDRRVGPSGMAGGLGMPPYRHANR
jgi:2,4-dienoyl-CoA reductase-like NADH-dependent reductase (Old Yellow Enzyme family)